MLETNIHPTAIISPKATLEEGVKIGPYSLVGEDVHIGRGTVMVRMFRLRNGQLS